MNTSNKCDYTRATYKNYVNSTTLIKQIENVITLDFPALWLRQIYCGKCLLPRFVRLAQCRLYQVLNCMEYFNFFFMDSITPSSYPWILSLYNGFYRWWNALLSASCCSYDVFFVYSWPILQKSFAEPFEYSSLWKSIIIDCIRMSDMCGMWIWHTF